MNILKVFLQYQKATHCHASKYNSMFNETGDLPAFETVRAAV